jgi:sterol desaturase/sphingolipid hydroxylase (fatty acid hydroxylase superfamily)
MTRKYDGAIARGAAMRLSKAGYFADFVVYPPVAATFIIATLRSASSLTWWESVLACLAGFLVWSFLEYVIHRFIFHEVRYFAAMHKTHHDDPSGFVGTPTWLSLAMICCGGLLPLWWGSGFDLASGFTAGLMFAYLWYVSVHHVVHHWQIGPGSYLYGLKRRHALHHHARQPCNFGLTCGFWDRVFGTAFTGR